uniref:Uncharacterized protein n=1 Tax=Ditylenchus dipsaci TaxID=166011 RepID=A0A915D8D4_9BILA
MPGEPLGIAQKSVGMTEELEVARMLNGLVDWELFVVLFFSFRMQMPKLSWKRILKISRKQSLRINRKKSLWALSFRIAEKKF